MKIFVTKFAEDYERNGQVVEILGRENEYQIKVRFPDGVVKVVYDDEVK